MSVEGSILVRRWHYYCILTILVAAKRDFWSKRTTIGIESEYTEQNNTQYKILLCAGNNTMSYRYRCGTLIVNQSAY